MSEEFKKVDEQELAEVAGGVNGNQGYYYGPWKTVRNLKKGWLALRTAPRYDYSNEIGHLYNGDDVQIRGKASGDYIWVWAPKLNKSGYVNRNFIG